MTRLGFHTYWAWVTECLMASYFFTHKNCENPSKQLTLGELKLTYRTCRMSLTNYSEIQYDELPILCVASVVLHGLSAFGVCCSPIIQFPVLKQLQPRVTRRILQTHWLTTRAENSTTLRNRESHFNHPNWGTFKERLHRMCVTVV